MNIAGTSLIAQYIGNGRKDEAKRTAGELISISIILSLGLGIPAALGSHRIVSLMGAEGEVLTNGVAF